MLTVWISHNERHGIVFGVALHQIGLHKEARLAGTRTTDDHDVFVPSVLWVLRPAAHCQLLCLSQNDIVFRVLVHKRLDVFSRTPSGRAVFHTLPELLGVLAAEINDTFYDQRPGNTDQNILPVKAWHRIMEDFLKVHEDIKDLFARQCAFSHAIEPADLICQIPDDHIGDIQDNEFLQVNLNSS